VNLQEKTGHPGLQAQKQVDVQKALKAQKEEEVQKQFEAQSNSKRKRT